MCWTLRLEFWFQDSAWSFSCVVWQETLLLNASLHEKYKWVLANCQQSLMKYRGGYFVIDWHPIQGGEVILLVTPRRRNWD